MYSNMPNMTLWSIVSKALLQKNQSRHFDLIDRRQNIVSSLGQLYNCTKTKTQMEGGRHYIKFI